MGRTNIYKVYSLRSTLTNLPFYIGYTKSNEDLISIQIKNGMEVTKTEILRRALLEVDAKLVYNNIVLSDYEKRQDEVERRLNREARLLKNPNIGPARKREFKTTTPILTADTIVENLTKHKAEEIANKCSTAIKIQIGGCLYEPVKTFLTIEEAKEVIKTYLPQLIGDEQQVVHPYATFEQTVEAQYRQILRARERVKLSRERRTTPEDVIVIRANDPFGAHLDGP